MADQDLYLFKLPNSRKINKGFEQAFELPRSWDQEEIIEHFEERYADILVTATDSEHEDVIYQGTRGSAMTFAEYVRNMQADWDKYEKAVAPVKLPEKLKVRLLLQHANLTNAQTWKVTARLAGGTSLAAIKEQLTKLDDNEEALDAVTAEAVKTLCPPNCTHHL